MSKNSNPHRSQVTISLSSDTFARVEAVSEKTGLSRSRLYELALIKFADWCEMVDPSHLIQLCTHPGVLPELGYQRRASGFRKAVTSAPPQAPQDPYSPTWSQGSVRHTHPAALAKTYPVRKKA